MCVGVFVCVCLCSSRSAGECSYVLHLPLDTFIVLVLDVTYLYKKAIKEFEFAMRICQRIYCNAVCIKLNAYFP